MDINNTSLLLWCVTIIVSAWFFRDAFDALLDDRDTAGSSTVGVVLLVCIMCIPVFNLLAGVTSWSMHRQLRR